MKLYSVFLRALLIVGMLLSPLPARADVQYIIPQTVDASLATNLNCTGTAQNFISGVTAGFFNLGQTQHYVTFVPAGVIQAQVEIDGIDNQGNVSRISDQAEAPQAATNQVLAASGRFPKIQVRVTCSPVSATFTLSYAGTSSTQNVFAGGYQLAQIDKVLFRNALANTTGNSDTFQTPYLNTLGTLVFTYNGGSIAGSSISLVCNSVGASNIYSAGDPGNNSFPIANVATAQVFQVPPAVCPLTNLVYTSGGATAATYTLEYVFTTPGALPNGVAQSCPNIATLTGLGAATTQIIPAVTSDKIRICSIELSNTNATGTSVSVVEGSGANCAVGQNPVIPPITLTANTGGSPNFSISLAPSAAYKTGTTSNALCLTGSAAGSVNAAMTFVQF